LANGKSVVAANAGRSKTIALQFPPNRRQMTKTIPNVALVVPTLNGGSLWRTWLEKFAEQSIRPARLLIIDSSSEDDTVPLAHAAGFEVITIARRDFDHGGSRQHGFNLVEPAEFVIFMTQDAILANSNSLELLVNSIGKPEIGAVYGRQLPRPTADCIEAHARLFNYPETGHSRSIADAPRLGIRAAFLSNSFAVYRRVALEQIGGFPSRLIFGEDAYVATRMLAKGWQIAYCADAPVYHSHAYSWLEYFRRYFDVGVLHARERWIGELVGGSGGEGVRFVKSELRFLSRNAPLQIPRGLSYIAAKLFGYNLGLNEDKLPNWAKLRMSLNRNFWEQDVETVITKKPLA